MESCGGKVTAIENEAMIEAMKKSEQQLLVNETNHFLVWFLFVLCFALCFTIRIWQAQM